LISDSDFEASNNSTDLIANTEGADWYESRNNVPALLTLDETNVSGNLGKKAKFTGSTTGNAYLSQELTPAQSGQFSVEWDILVDDILVNSDPERAGWMLIGDDNDGVNGPCSTNNDRFVYMAFEKDGGATEGTAELVARDRNDNWGEGEFTSIATLNLDQWYTIRVDLDLDADTYDVYVDGVYQKTVTSRVQKSSVTHISFAQWDDGAGTFYIDNVQEAFPVCADADGDTYSSEGPICGPIDCDDSNASINPGATEVCDEVDNNCDGSIDEGVTATFYYDADTDTYGNSSVSVDACEAPTDYVEDNTDCDDSNMDVNPGVAEICGNSIDDNCIGEVDEGCGECTTGETRACSLQEGVCAGSEESCVDGSWAG